MADVSNGNLLTPPSRSQGGRGQTIILALLLCVVAVDVLLMRKVSALSASAEGYRTAISTLLNRNSLHVGSVVGPILGKSVNGDTITVSFAKTQIPTVLYAFTAECPWCKRNLPNLHTLIGSEGSRYRLVGLALTRTGLKEYLTAEKLSFPVVTDIDPKVRSAYGLAATPETIVVSPDGKVLKIWVGAYVETTVKDINSYLGVRLSPVVLPNSTPSESSD